MKGDHCKACIDNNPKCICLKCAKDLAYSGNCCVERRLGSQNHFSFCEVRTCPDFKPETDDEPIQPGNWYESMSIEERQKYDAETNYGAF
jgi:hypothetical protein